MSMQYLVLEEIRETIDLSPETAVASIQFNEGGILRSILGAQIDYTLAIGQPEQHWKDPVVEVNANGMNFSAINVRDNKGISIGHITKGTDDKVDGHKVIEVDYTPTLRKFVNDQVKNKKPCKVIINDQKFSIFTETKNISVRANPVEQLEEENFFIKITEAEAKQKFTGSVKFKKTTEFEKWFGSIWNLCHQSIFLNKIIDMDGIKTLHSIAYNEQAIRDTFLDSLFFVRFESPKRKFMAQRIFSSKDSSIEIEGNGFSTWRFNWNTLKKALDHSNMIQLLLPSGNDGRYITEFLGEHSGISFIEPQQKEIEMYLKDIQEISKVIYNFS